MQVQDSTKTTATSSGTGAAKDNSTLGKDDFLKLLMAQIRNQDPLKPMDDSQFMSQLTQFSMLEQLQEMGQQMATMLSVEQLGQANALVGKMVEGLDPKTGERVKGVVSGAGMEGGKAFITIGDKTLKLDNVERVTDADATKILTASGMIGREVVANDAVSGASTTGLVKSVRVEAGKLLITVGDREVPLESVVSAKGQANSAVTGAGSLIGKEVGAVLESNGQYVSGVVNSARLEGGEVLLSVAGRTVKLGEVTTVAAS